MSVSPIPHAVPASSAEGAPPGFSAAQLHALSQAAEIANRNQAAGQGREYSIAFDRRSHQMVVRVVDSATRDVLEQVPAEYLVQLAGYFESLPKGS